MEGETVSLDHLEELLDDTPPFNVLSGAERRQLFDEALLASTSPARKSWRRVWCPRIPAICIWWFLERCS